MKYIWAFFVLAGCAASSPVFKPVPVDMPVIVLCKTTSVPQPNFALMHTTPNDDLFIKTRAALVELDQRKAYEAELQSRITACQ